MCSAGKKGEAAVLSTARHLGQLARLYQRFLEVNMTNPTQGQHDQPPQGPSPSPSSTVAISFLYTAFYRHGLQGVPRYLPLPRRTTSSQWPKSRCTTAFSSLSTLNSLALSTTTATATTHRLLPESTPPHHQLRHPSSPSPSCSHAQPTPANGGASCPDTAHRNTAQQAHTHGTLSPPCSLSVTSSDGGVSERRIRPSVPLTGTHSSF